jgi:predicted neuraminidase
MKIYKLILLVATTMAISCNQSISFKDGILVEEFIFDTAGFPSCHAATIAETPVGLVTAFFGGTHERNPDVCIYLSRNVEGKWTPPGEVANGIVNDTLRYPTWNPVLYHIPDGDLMLFYKVGPSPSTWKGMLMLSKDAGITWSDPEPLPEGYIGPVKNKPLLLENGDLLCGSSTEDDGWKIHFEVTPDFGKTWTKVGPINDSKIYNAIQPSILNHGNGKLQILCRTKNAVIAESWSLDTGKTWSLLHASQLPNNNSGLDAITLKDGRQLIVYNHVKTPQEASKGYRTPLNVALSLDGKSWYAALVLEDSEIGQYSYPSVMQSSDGMVHIVYTWRREKIKYVKIDPVKLKTRKIEDEKWPG